MESRYSVGARVGLREHPRFNTPWEPIAVPASFSPPLHRFHLMAVLIVLFASWLFFRALGAIGVPALATWQNSALYALAVMFVFTSIAHFNKMKHDLARMIPPSFPRPLWLVYITGGLELLGAAGLLLPKFRLLSGVCLIVLLIAMFTANVHAARNGISLRGKPVTPLWLRVPMQILFIALLWWSTGR